MAMTKAGMESHVAAYNTCIGDARQKLTANQFSAAVAAAVSSWPSVDGMMQYAIRYANKQFKSIEAFDIVLNYAPLLFDVAALDGLASLLQSQRRIDRNTTVDESQMLADARQLMRDARRLWNLIEKNGNIEQSALAGHLGGDRNRWRRIAEAWETMGILIHKDDAGSPLLQFATRMNEVTRAKCSACGTIAKRPKSELLAMSPCAACRAVVSYVLLS